MIRSLTALHLHVCGFPTESASEINSISDDIELIPVSDRPDFCNTRDVVEISKK